MLRKDPFITGEYYHVYNRGIDKRVIFKLKKDYERFMMLLYIANSNNSFRLDDLLNKKCQTFDEILVLDKGEPLVSIGAWCLMTNHFHLLVRQEMDEGITKFMKKLGTGYSMFFNIKYQRTGGLFGGPFKSKLIGTDDNYMRHLFGYIHINPLEIKFPGWQDEINKSLIGVNKNMTRFLENYRYSSYLDYTGETRIEKNIIKTENFPDYFESARSFEEFIKSYLYKD
jgi:putative transposase